MIKAAIFLRGVVFFFLSAFMLDVAYLTLVYPHMPPPTPEGEVLMTTIVFSAILMPAIAIAVLDIRRQLKKYGFTPGQNKGTRR